MCCREREELYPALDRSEHLFVERVIGDYLESGDASAFRPSLLHGDLSSDHVLFEEASKSVSAIIDFGDMMIGDPAWDLVFIYEDYGLDFLSRLLWHTMKTTAPRYCAAHISCTYLTRLTGP